MPDLLPLNSTIGRYSITDLIGEGGMGQVYRARQLDTGEFVALKALSLAAYSSPSGVARFRNEAYIQYNLQHPSIAKLYEYMEIVGRPCIVMEYVDGLTLDEHLRGFGPIPPAQALQYLKSLAEALSYIHSCGVVHRDLKATNVKITSAGQIKILDFGIAHEEHLSGLTRVGYVIGTLENLAPEQALGGKGDARSDIWALGILLYQMVTARLPFEDTQPERLTAKIIQGSYVPARDLAPSIPGSVGRIVERCLKIKPWERYQSATELLSAIDNATRQGNTGATRLARLWKDARGTPWIWALVVPALLLFLLLRMANPGPSTPPAVMPPPANLTPAPEPPRPPKPVPQPDNRDPNNKRKNPGESKTGEAVYDPYLIRQEAKPPEPPPQPQLPAPPQPQPQFPPQPTPPLVPKQRPVEQRKRGSAGKPIVIRVEAVEGPADLYVNGVLIPGRTPCSFQSIDGQEVELRLTRPGYQEFKTKITAGDRPGGLYRFSLKR